MTRYFKNGAPAQFKCENCRRKKILCSPPRFSATPLECEPCKTTGIRCGGYTKRSKRKSSGQQDGRNARFSTPPNSQLLSPPDTRSTTGGNVRSRDIAAQGDTSPSRRAPAPIRRMNWDHQDLFNATNLLQLARIELSVLQRQRQRLVDLFIQIPEIPILKSRSEYVEDMARAIQSHCSEQLATIPQRSADYVLLQQARSSTASGHLGLSFGVPSSSDQNADAEVNTLDERLNNDDSGSALIALAQAISQSRNGLSKANLKKLHSLGEAFSKVIPSIEEKFGVKAPLSFKTEVKESLLPILICGSWDCEVESETFVDFSFLWNWIRSPLCKLLDEDADLLWLQDRKEVVRQCFAQNWTLDRHDEFGHTFLHNALLVNRQERSAIFNKRQNWILDSLSQRSLMHYAAALGDENVCRALGFGNGTLKDSYKRPPIFYAIQKRHLSLAEILAEEL
ncbi:hypothetical protein GGR55DRAFT_650825 [Xylaria sp. FL0064]|nr:hypothetical protein GGR55DRAFT_650825 [Xylaria sp. FL0064]